MVRNVPTPVASNKRPTTASPPLGLPRAHVPDYSTLVVSTRSCLPSPPFVNRRRGLCLLRCSAMLVFLLREPTTATCKVAYLARPAWPNGARAWDWAATTRVTLVKIRSNKQQPRLVIQSTAHPRRSPHLFPLAPSRPTRDRTHSVMAALALSWTSMPASSSPVISPRAVVLAVRILYRTPAGFPKAAGISGCTFLAHRASIVFWEKKVQSRYGNRQRFACLPGRSADYLYLA